MEQKQNKVALFVIVLAAIVGASSVTLLQVYAQGSHSESDSTPIAAVVMMTTDSQEMLYSAL